MDIELFCGILAAALVANGLSAAFLYALFWGDSQIRRGRKEETFPWWWFIGAGAAPIVGAVAAYVALY